VTAKIQTIIYLAALLHCGCNRRADDCNWNSSCAPNGGAPSNSEGGASGGGSSNQGGTSNSDKGGTTSGPCNDACSGSTPVCDEATDKCVACGANADCNDEAKPVCDTSTNKCVACLANTDCKDSSKSVCDTDKNVCVGCLASSDCKDTSKPVCNTATNSCVACLANSDCTTATASRCDTTTNTCTACSTDSDCSQIPGKGVCDAGTCVQCTATKETACGTYSCNPATSACTTTTRDSVDYCKACVADSECIGGNVAMPIARCVPMNFNGTTHGNYCLQRVVSAGASGCNAPYTIAISAQSLSGAAAESYCGINQSATTCEAVIDMIASKTCSVDTDCGNEQGGLCKTVGTKPNRCTIPCSVTDDCPSSINLCTGAVPYCH
jgi:hypothetical protein